MLFILNLIGSADFGRLIIHSTEPEDNGLIFPFTIILRLTVRRLWGNFSYKLLHCSCIFSFILIAALVAYILEGNAGQLGPRTTRTETCRPVSEHKSARKRGLVGPYVKTTRTVLLFYNIVQYLYVNNY